ncbi:DUF6397 family protein [Streptomyces sp. NPDC008121]|uniref:DUF6397 family protein n=1 Tax=Streptomyces sp. NPDC008121 TaxID=3364809 RepID=UPI0036E82A81
MTLEESARTLALGRAAQELELRREEFRLAVQLGLVRTVPGAASGAPGRGGANGTRGTRGALAAGGARRRGDRQEIDRLRAAPDFPDGLRERVRAVGTTEAAELLSVTPDRFTKLARTGHVSPVRFYLNRYRAVVWLYLAGELGEFARARPDLLTGRLPRPVREKLDAGDDHRPRNWRARRLGLLLRATEDPWQRAAAIASLLDPVQLAEVVDDPYERAYLDRLRPEPPSGRTDSAAAVEITDRLLLADDPDEILWHRLSLILALDAAREERPAPRPDGGARPVPAFPPVALPPRLTALPEDPAVTPELPAAAPPRTAVLPRPARRRTARGLLDRLRRRKEIRASGGPGRAALARPGAAADRPGTEGGGGADASRPGTEGRAGAGARADRPTAEGRVGGET